MGAESYKRILIATDGSENVKNAVDWAVELARATRAQLFGVYVVPGVSIGIASRGASWAESFKEHLQEEGAKAVEYVEDSAKKVGVDVEAAVLEGNPTDVILEYADNNGIDLIVMGTLGKTGIKRFLLGSVAENVVRHSAKQVLVVP
ncbi:nucleotide-binding universal stress UspA family protein [Methanohalophilus levihalophilus]|uniref:universal stress protein n=1 Tax=Methanohalophilus levihalophilus TaxID=1431282 RepID=UPI001AEAB3D7|nr:universal stress protein [Methanohalophilus levihalophilus]MBP2029156.1 nucleotide-binding universal stress UspA family protein [Methanohalophilus levihalophilus]